MADPHPPVAPTARVPAVAFAHIRERGVAMADKLRKAFDRLMHKNRTPMAPKGPDGRRTILIIDYSNVTREPTAIEEGLVRWCVRHPDGWDEQRVAKAYKSGMPIDLCWLGNVSIHFIGYAYSGEHVSRRERLLLSKIIRHDKQVLEGQDASSGQ